MSDTPTPTTTATVELPTDALAAVDDRAADEHLTDPEDVREVALDYVDQVEVLTDDGEPRQRGRVGRRQSDRDADLACLQDAAQLLARARPCPRNPSRCLPPGRRRAPTLTNTWSGDCPSVG